MDGADESREAVEELICALVSIGIAGLLDGLGVGDVAASMRSALNIGAARVSDAFKRDLERILERNAREARDDASSSSSQTAADAAADESVWSDEEHERKTAAHDGAVRAQTFVSRACGDAAVQTVTSYQRVLNGMAHDINTIGYERAAKAAMRRFEDAGITCAVYDRNGRKVRLSLQAVVNRELSSIGNRVLFDQTISLAKRTGDNLVEVSTTANCRESHASWQGGIYQLEGSGEHRNFYTACRWGDPVNGIGGYNCGHRFRIYRPADGRRFEDPLDGTGYTTEDARRLKGAQRRYERIIRNAKLEIEAIDRSGIDDATKAELKRASRSRMADARTRMNMLIAEHPKLLKREQWRERTYTQNAGGYGVGAKTSPQGPVPGIKLQAEHVDAGEIRDGVHRNGVTFVEYKGHKADYGTHRLPNGGTFVGLSRERAVELLKERYGGGMEESLPAGNNSSEVVVSNESSIQANERQFNIKTKKGRTVRISSRRLRKNDGGSVSYEKTPREEFGIMIDPQAADPYALSNIRNHGNEVRDLYAHEMLRAHGFNVVVRSSKAIGRDGKQLDCVSNVDLDIDGVMWEVKSPTEFGPRTIRQQLNKAVKRNFKNPYDDITMSGLGGDITPRVVINLKYVDTGNIDVVAEVASEMAECRVESVLLITGDGTVTEIKK